MPRIIRLHQTGGPEVLQIDELDLPAPKAGEVRIAAKALGLNRVEAMFRAGHFPEELRLPSRLGFEVAGTVEAVGEGVTDFKPGDAVSTIPTFPQGDYGVYGEVAVVPVSAVVKHPASLSWEQAGAVWMAYSTAYGALIDIGKLAAGDTLLIPAASSSVGLAAIQIANLVGAIPVELTRGKSKRESLLDAGAAHVIVTEEDDVVAEVMKVTGGKGARMAFDPVGGPALAKLTAAAAEGGIIFQYGELSPEPTVLPLDVQSKGLTVRGYLLYEISQNPARLAPAKRFIIDGLASGHLTPIIAKTFPLDQIVEAHRYLESNQQFGKIVVTV